MSWLTINGVKLAGVVALGGETGAERRDIGAKHEASDGSMVVTRQIRKRDLKFTTPPLTGAQAFAWESMLVGEGNVWPFDSHFYSSTGIGGAGSIPAPDVAVQAIVKKFGAGALKVAGGESWLSSGLGLGAVWTFSTWHRIGAGAFVHEVVRSDGAKWVDGVRNDAYAADGVAAISGTEISLANASSVHYYDDVVACPYLWLDAWAAQVFASGLPFGQLPFLTAAGDLVREAATRKMVCVTLSEKVLVAGLGGSLQRDARVLQVELKGA